MSSIFVDLTPFRESPAYFRLWLGATATQIAGQFTAVAVGFHAFALTGQTIAVALVAFYALVPTIIIGIYGGAVIDAYDRRQVASLSVIASLLATGALAAIAWLGVETLTPYYVLTTIVSVTNTLANTARAAIVPRLIRRELLTSAAAHRGIGSGLSASFAPALAGVLAAVWGYPTAYSVNVLILGIGLFGILSIPAIPPLEKVGRPGLRTVLDGLRFVRQASNVKASIFLDLVSMILCHPRALFPAVGMTVIGGGPMTAGILGTAVAAGAFLNALLSGNTRHVRRQGRATVIATALYAVCILAFGLVLLVAGTVPASADATGEINMPALIVAFVLLALAGAFDNLTAIYRSAILQAAVPDQFRGRVQGVFSVAVTTGPRLGDMFVGVLSLVGAIWFPPLLGGCLLLLMIGIGYRLYRGLWAYDATNPTA